MENTAPIISQLLLIAFLTFVNAFFSASEMAIISINKTKIRFLVESGNKRATRLQELLENPTNFLSTIQVGITLAGFLSSAAAATGMAMRFSFALEKMNIPYAYNIAIILITIILSFVTLVFGELIPKRIALLYSEKIALAVVGPIRIISYMTKPFILILSFTTHIIIRMLGIKDNDLAEQISKEEIQSLIKIGQEQGTINDIEKVMLDSIISFDVKTAKEVMTPRRDVFAININDKAEHYLKEMANYMYSRIPIYEGNIDNIIGILYLKDFFAEAYRIGDVYGVEIRKIMRTPFFVPEMKKVDILFKELQGAKRHLAILIDEYGGVSGVVTIEDLIEEVMGEIEDEFDDEIPDIIRLDDCSFLIKGMTNLADVNEALGTHISIESDIYDTIGGYLISHLGHIPQNFSTQPIFIDPYLFYVLQVNENRIEEVKLILPTCDWSLKVKTQEGSVPNNTGEK